MQGTVPNPIQKTLRKAQVIRVTRLDGTELVINCDLIEFVEETPDTIISLSTDRKIMVRESAQEVIDEVIVFKRMTHLPIIGRPEDEGSTCLEGSAVKMLADATDRG